MNPLHAQAPRRIDQPEPGLFRLRLVKGGPYVAAEIRQGDDGVWQAWINGKPSEPGHVDPALAKDVFRVWTSGFRVEKGEHAYLLATAAWARQHQPNNPLADPTRPVRLGSAPSAF